MPGWLAEAQANIHVLSEVLKEYKQSLRNYEYDYLPEDVEVIASCGKDTRPLTYALLPATAAFWAGGRATSRLLPAAPSLPLRLGASAVRLFLSVQALRMGHAVGTYRKADSCMRGLVALQTPLGGEICAILRAKDPNSPYLQKYERPPGDILDDGARPRIATEANRLAKLQKKEEEGRQKAQPPPAAQEHSALPRTSGSSSSSGMDGGSQHQKWAFQTGLQPAEDAQEKSSTVAFGGDLFDVMGMQLGSWDDAGQQQQPGDDSAAIKAQERMDRRRRHRRRVRHHRDDEE